MQLDQTWGPHPIPADQLGLLSVPSITEDAGGANGGGDWENLLFKPF